MTENLTLKKKVLADFKWRVLPELSKTEWMHITVITQNVKNNPGTHRRGNRGKYVLVALRILEREGRVVCLKDDNFLGTYWRAK
jgi:hypothetical protein